MPCEIGKFAVLADGEECPDGFLAIRMSPHSHYAAYPWWSEPTRAVLEAMPEAISPGMDVLDFGCGEARSCRALPARLAQRSTRSSAPAESDVATVRATLWNSVLIPNPTRVEIDRALARFQSSVALLNLEAARSAAG